MNIPYAFKECSKCGEWLVANNYNFGKAKKGRWGLKSQCKKCEKEYNKQYYENNKEYLKGYSREYREDNKEHCKEYGKQYREDNKEYYKEYGKQYREDNKEHCKEYGKQWREDNPQVIFNNHNKRRNKLENQGNGITKEQWYEMMKFFDWKCAYSNIYLGNENNKNIRSVDHILAIDNGGLNEIWNCIPMVKSYNSSKNKRVDVINWYMEQEYFDINRLERIVEWQVYAYEKWGGEEFGELILITDLFEEK